MGCQHQNVSMDEYSITLTLERPSGITLLFPLSELEHAGFISIYYDVN